MEIIIYNLLLYFSLLNFSISREVNLSDLNKPKKNMNCNVFRGDFILFLVLLKSYIIFFYSGYKINNNNNNELTRRKTFSQLSKANFFFVKKCQILIRDNRSLKSRLL